MTHEVVGIVAGAAGGIGSAIALRLAAQGAHLVITDLDETGLLQVAGQHNGGSGRLIPVPGNVLDPELGLRLVDKVLSELEK